MTRRQKTVLLPLVGAMVAAACAPLGFGARPPAPPPVIVDSTPPRPDWVAPPAVAVERSDEATLERLMRFGAVWHAVRWWHPDVVQAGAAWDTAYLRHVERAREARDDAAFADAVAALLGELNDPASRVVRGDTTRAATFSDERIDAPERGARDTTDRLAVVMTNDSVLLTRPVQLRGGDLSSLARTLPVQASVLDLRGATGDVAGLTWASRAVRAEELTSFLTQATPLVARSVRRGAPDAPNGTVPNDPTDFAWVLQPLPVAVPTGSRTGAATARRTPRVVIVDDATLVPPELLALRASGVLAIVSTGTGVLYTTPRQLLLPLSGDAIARIRLATWETADGRRLALRADTTVRTAAVAALAPDTLDVAVRTALAIVRGTARPQHAVETRSGVAQPARAVVNDPPSPLTRAAMYPSLPERLLAVTQLWGVVRAFSPYLPMADEDWDQAFLEALGAAETSSSSRQWGRTMLRFAAALDASQVDVDVPDHPEFERERGVVPFTMSLVDGRPVVTAIDDTAAARSGLRVGDEVMAIGGEPIDKRFERLRPLISASNAWSREERLRDWLTQGPADTKATFRVRDNGAPRDVEFQYANVPPRARTTPVLRVDTLAANVVRVRPGVPRLLLSDALRDAPAIIVDLRGVRDAASARGLAGTVLDGDAREYARDERTWLEAPPTGPLRAPELDAARRSTRTVRRTPARAGDTFDGPVAVLVDATTQGDGELLALRLLAGGRARVLVGAPTAGAVGDVAELRLAGGVRITVPVRDVRHADGRFVQRLGLSPSVNVTPTVTGVRNGRDEVLEAAQRWIAQQLAPPPSRRR